MIILINSFTKDKIKFLISNIITEPKDPNDMKQSHSYPFLSHQILKVDNSSIYDYFFMNDNEYLKAHPIEKEENKQNVIDNNNKEDNNIKDEDNIESNEMLEYLFEFFKNENNPTNYVLAGYFSSVLTFLFEKRTLQLLKYLYYKRIDIVEKIIHFSYLDAFSSLAEKVLNFRGNVYDDEDSKIQLMIEKRNNSILEIFKSLIINSDQNTFKIETMINLIKINNDILSYCLNNDKIMGYIYRILTTEIKTEDQVLIDNFTNLYCILLNFMCEVFKAIIKNDIELPSYKKDKKILPVYGSIFNKSLFYIINNFKERDIKLKTSANLEIKCIGQMNMSIFDYIIGLFPIEVKVSDLFDTKLIESGFVLRATNFFLTYQLNDMYKNKYLDFVKLYLNIDNIERKVTSYLFAEIQLHKVILQYVTKIPRFNFNSGNSMVDPIYPFIIAIGFKMNNIIEENKDKFKNRKGSFTFFRVGEEDNIYQPVAAPSFFDKISNFFSSNKINSKLNKYHIKEYLDKDWSNVFNEKITPVIMMYEKKEEVIQEPFFKVTNENNNQEEEDNKENKAEIQENKDIENDSKNQ